MAIFEHAARELLTVVENPQNGDFFLFLGAEGFVFEYRRNYQGLMADISPKYKQYARDKQGYFDIRGTMQHRTLTHTELFSNLLSECTYDECLSVWRGQMPNVFGPKKYALMSLAMLMFEQEINFGNENFQRKSHFSHRFGNPNSKRPRDLIMGYVNYMYFNNNIECLNRFQDARGLLKLPQSIDSDIEREYFTVLENDTYARALMARDNIVNEYRRVVAAAPINPKKL